MTRKIGIIGGGQMAEAIIKGLLNTKGYKPSDLHVSEPLETRRLYLEQTYGLQTTDSALHFMDAIDLLLLAVKPQVMSNVLDSVRNSVDNKLVISIAAGLPLAYYSEKLANNDVPVIRVMPNVSALVQQAASALCRNKNVSDEDFEFALSLFRNIGTAVAVEEHLMDAVTGLSGSGPAYVLCFLEALIDSGVKLGLSRATSRELALQTVLGTTSLLQETESHPAELRDQVTSPGGTTASGLHVLENNSFKGTIISAVEAAFNKSKELGQK